MKKRCDRVLVDNPKPKRASEEIVPYDKEFNLCQLEYTISDDDFQIPKEVPQKCQHDYAEFGGEDEYDGEEEDFGRQDDGSARRGSEMETLFQNSQSFTEIPYYAGAPLQEKHYRPDYPHDLKLRKKCEPVPGAKFRTMDGGKTQPIATFSPVSSTDRLLELKKEAEQATMKMNQLETRRSQQDLQAGAQPNAELRANKNVGRAPPPIVSIGDEHVVSYIQDHNIQMLFEYFLGQCILQNADNPFTFIADLADKLMKGRKNEAAFKEIPRTLSPEHIDAMFRMYDRVGTGIITYSQYMNAMQVAGVINFNEMPAGYEEDQITKEVFATEANQAVDDLLKSFIFKRGPDSA